MGEGEKAQGAGRRAQRGTGDEPGRSRKGAIKRRGKGSGAVRFYNFPCPSCGYLVRPYAGPDGRIVCTNCRQEITQAVRGMLKVSWLNRVREGIIGFATCGKCGTLVFAKKQEGPEDDEYWTCTQCGSLVFV